MDLKNKLEQITESGFKRMSASIVQVIEEGIEELKSNNLQSKALKAGDTIPDVLLRDINNEPVSIKDFVQNEFLVLNFYRGGWCPYCNLELKAYEQLRHDFQEIGGDIIAISAESPTYTSNTSDKNTLTYPILTDTNAQLSNEIGIGFELNDDLKKAYNNFGIDLKKLHNSDKDELLVPAVYVVNRELKILMEHVEENYMTRIEPSLVLQNMRELNVTSQ